MTNLLRFRKYSIYTLIAILNIIPAAWYIPAYIKGDYGSKILVTENVTVISKLGNNTLVVKSDYDSIGRRIESNISVNDKSYNSMKIGKSYKMNIIKTKTQSFMMIGANVFIVIQCLILSFLLLIVLIVISFSIPDYIKWFINRNIYKQ